MAKTKANGYAVRVPEAERVLAMKIISKLNLPGLTLPDIVKLAIRRLAKQERVA